MKKVFSALILFGLLLAADTYGATRYVSPAGSGSTCSDPSPCSLTTGLAATASGDTLLLKDGTYAGVSISNAIASGISASQPTIIQAENTRLAILTPVAGTDRIFNFSSVRSHITIRGLRLDCTGGSVDDCTAITFVENPAYSNFNFEDNIFENGADDLVYVASTASFINFRRNLFDVVTSTGGPSNLLYYQGRDGIIEYNEFKNGESCVNLRNGTANTGVRNIIRYNYCHTLTSADTGSRAMSIANDVASAANANIFHNNVIANAQRNGFRVDGGAFTKIYNNTIYSVGGYGILVDPGVENADVRNNIIRSIGGASLTDNGTGTTKSNNFCDDAVTGCAATDPLMIDPANGDFNLAEGSTCIDGGFNISGFSSGRFVGSAPDCGPFEAPIRSGAVVQNGDADNYLITFSLASQSSRGGVGLQGCTTANWAIVVAGAGATESTCTITGTNRVDVDLAANVTNGQSLTDAYTRGTLTDNVCIGDPNGTCLNAKVRTYAALTGTNEVGAAPAGGFEVVHFRCLSWYSDTSPAATDWLRAEDSAINCPLRPGGLGAVVIAVARNTDATPPIGLDWYANRAAGAYAAMTNSPTATTLAFAAQAAPSMSDLASIATAILTDPHTNYIAGAVVAQQASQPTIPFEADSTSNIVILYKGHASMAVGDVYCIQPALAGLTPTSVTQTVTGCVEIVNPSAGS